MILDSGDYVDELFDERRFVDQNEAVLGMELTTRNGENATDVCRCQPSSDRARKIIVLDDVVDADLSDLADFKEGFEKKIDDFCDQFPVLVKDEGYAGNVVTAVHSTGGDDLKVILEVEIIFAETAGRSANKTYFDSLMEENRVSSIIIASLYGKLLINLGRLQRFSEVPDSEIPNFRE